MNTNKLELEVGTSKIKDKPSTATRPSKMSKPTRRNSLHLELRKDSPDKVSKQRPSTPDNEPAVSEYQGQTERTTKNATYRTPLFSLFPPVSQNGAIFGEEDSESSKSWKREYKNARYLMERQKARYLAFKRGREKAILCKECETKGEKTLRIACENRRKQNKGKNSDKMFLIEGHVVKEFDKPHTFDSRNITSSYLSRSNEIKTCVEKACEKQNKIISTKRRTLSKIPSEKLQPWLTEDRNVTGRHKMKQGFPLGCSGMYLPHHC